MRKMFKVSDKSPNGVSYQASFVASYAQLVTLLGEPNSAGDEYKVSTEWLLEDENGHVVTIYDYKETSLYDNDLPSVEEFRALPSFEWTIGALSKDTSDCLADWLVEMGAG